MTDAYTFSPGYLVAANGSAPLHAEWSAMSEAHLYCDAEPRTPRPRLQPQANRPPSPHPAPPRLITCLLLTRASLGVGSLLRLQPGGAGLQQRQHEQRSQQR